MTHFFSDLYDAHLTFGGTAITWREIVGNAFGFASAIGGLRRRVWAWPIGIVGNVLLFTVFIAVTFGADERGPLLGQAGRQVFFILTSIYGWHRWRQTRMRVQGDAAVRPRWATPGERVGYLVAAVAGIVLCRWLFGAIGAGFPVPSWYFWCDAWIFVGSMLATYAMARGWTDFWLVWIAVDLVGVPELWHFQLYPSALLYMAYMLLVLYGFVVWLRIGRRETRAPEEVGVA
ncbi:nicotinamide riboside transporter PnuC [Nocardioides mangrovicus]|uniref:Nicotinamide riboside transporter PnuC n=1 Tax=Nocardioides mangrovicus TaxID=2478913 RepID=A0A3L8P4A5_9ACTN|nr:nicotinamide mononucleotide transporter family protein [Nocardioides mangrovicus]RLV50236.1 nicotinamide riboside transporter PnuC [Nocardioides mangrovicus]